MSVDETKDCLLSSLSISIDKLTYSGSGAKEMANNINALRQLFYRHMPYISGFTSMSKVHIYFYLQEVKDKIIIIRKFHLHMHCFLTVNIFNTQRSQKTPSHQEYLLTHHHLKILPPYFNACSSAAAFSIFFRWF